MHGNLFGTSSVIVGTRMAGALAGFVTQILLAHLLGAHDLGVFYIAVSLATLIGVCGSLGYPMIMARLVTRYRLKGRPGVLAHFTRTAKRDSLVCSAGLFALAAALILAWPDGTWPIRFALLVGAATGLPYAVLLVNEAHAIALSRFALGSLPELFIRPMILLAVATGVVLAGIAVGPLGTVWFALVFLALTGAITAVHARLFRSTIHATAPDQHDCAVPLVRRQRERLAWHWRGTAVPLILVALFTGYLCDYQVLLTGLFLPPDQAAVFTVALKITFMIGFGIQAVNQIVSPELARSLAVRDGTALAAALRRGNLLNVAGCVAATAGMAVVGSEILGLFSPSFEAGYPTLLVLSLSPLARAVAGPADIVLTLAGQQRLCMKVFMLTALVLAGLNALLLPLFGPIGGAVAVALSTIVWTVALALQAHRITGCRTDALAGLTGALAKWYTGWHQSG